MDRRDFSAAAASALGALLLATYETAHALSVADLTDQEASSGL